MIEIRDQRSAASNQKSDIRRRNAGRLLCTLSASAVKPISDIRVLISGLCVLLLALCAHVEAQQPAKIPLLGYQSAGSSGEREGALRQGLREVGYVEGRNIAVEWRFAEGKREQVPRNTAELIRLRVDVIVSGGATDTRAAKVATSTIPIVMTNESDPVGTGLIASLSRPGGNITGLATLSAELTGKRLELLKETIPRLSHAVVLRRWGNTTSRGTQKETESAARSLGLKLQFLDVTEPDDLNGVFEAITEARTGALIVDGGPYSTGQRKRIVDFAAKSRLPVIYYSRGFVEAGGLISYDANRKELSRRAAIFVDKILKGANPANLPVEQPTKFEIVINLKTAKQIGLTIPPNVLARADRVIR